MVASQSEHTEAVKCLKAIGTATAGMALAVQLFSLKKNKRKALLTNTLELKVPST